MIKKVLAAVTMVATMAAASAAMADALPLWFAPDWKSKPEQAKQICDALSKGSGYEVQPRIAKNYPEILGAFAAKEPALTYVGSFAQAIIHSRSLGQALVQGVNGKEYYAGVMIYPKGQDPAAILQNSPTEIAFAAGASSGESSAKAATAGQAAFKVQDHAAAVGAVKAGKAKAAVVKDHWWSANAARFPEMDVYLIPGVSEDKNPDNVLTASNAVTPEAQEKIKQAAMASKDAFGVQEVVPFDPAKLDFSVNLMKTGKLDPATYSWE